VRQDRITGLLLSNPGAAATGREADRRRYLSRDGCTSCAHDRRAPEIRHLRDWLRGPSPSAENDPSEGPAFATKEEPVLATSPG
jgi:hypothetical protein